MHLLVLAEYKAPSEEKPAEIRLYRTDTYKLIGNIPYDYKLNTIEQMVFKYFADQKIDIVTSGYTPKGAWIVLNATKWQDCLSPLPYV